MKIVANNRKALHDYHVLESFEAGLVLTGSEVKSLRQGMVSISDAYGDISDGEVYVFNLHITNYRYSSAGKLDPKRKRKILLNKKEIKKLYGLVQQRGNTMIPLKIYFTERGYAKMQIGVCRRKRLYDKKEKILKKEEERKIAKARKIMR
ncbi:MAG: SsrA-binding protein SmpB [candidate division WOR-3 bacterium]|nr:MAG: SsrA-binding protein SmpB [candidate division WOR-3 bacterium]